MSFRCKRKRGQTRSDNSYSTQFARQNPLCTRFPRPSSTFPFCQHELHLSEKDSSSEEISFSFFDQVCFRSSHSTCETLSGFLKIIPVRNNIMSNLVRSAGPEEESPPLSDVKVTITACLQRVQLTAPSSAMRRRNRKHPGNSHARMCFQIFLQRHRESSEKAVRLASPQPVLRDDLQHLQAIAHLARQVCTTNRRHSGLS